MDTGMTTSLKAAIAFAYLIMISTQMAWAQLTTIATLVPPTGNSPKMVLKACNAYRVYNCLNSSWVLSHGFANLLDAKTGKMVGNYSVVNGANGEVRNWTLFNSVGDWEESGDQISWVTGKVLATVDSAIPSNLASVLSQADSHGNDGFAALISYIQSYNFEAGGPPAQTCSSSTPAPPLTVSFNAWFCMWYQDPVPPTPVPRQLTPPGRFIQGFFAQGVISFTFDGSAWTESSRVGSIQSLPGSPVIGAFWENGGVQTWQLYQPNGFTVSAMKSNSTGVQVTKTACDWSLSSVTYQSSSSWSVGPCTHVQTTSTRGGLPPSTATTPIQGAIQNVTFSALLWFFTNDAPTGSTY